MNAKRTAPENGILTGSVFLYSLLKTRIAPIPQIMLQAKHPARCRGGYQPPARKSLYGLTFPVFSWALLYGRLIAAPTKSMWKHCLMIYGV